MLRVALLLRGESFRLGSQGTRCIGSPESVKEQIAASESHLKLCRTLKAAGFQVDIFFVTVDTAFSRQLYEIYRAFLKDTILLNEHLPCQNDMIRMAVNMLPIQEYDSVILSRIDLIYRAPLITSVNPALGKVQFLAPTWYNNCVTPRGAPKMNDMFYIFPRLAFDVLQKAQELSAYGEDFLDVIPLHPGEYRCISELFFEPDSEKDTNPYYRIANRPESTVFHSSGKVYPTDFPPPR